MTLRRELNDAEVRQLYDWWLVGEISVLQAAQSLRCSRDAVLWRWAAWDEGCRQRVERRQEKRKVADRRRLARSLSPQRCGSKK